MAKLIRQLLVLLLLVPVAVSAAQYERIYVFGDSLSDTGNLASVVGDFPEPPYFQNRVNNGLVAVEILASRLDLTLNSSLHLIGPAQGTNYAVAGARATRNEPNDLATQVALFLANHGGVAPENALYVMFLGGNDIRAARDNPDPLAASQTMIDAAQIIGNHIQVLSMAGARHWLVLNSPDIGGVPETRLIAEYLGNPDFPAYVSGLSTLFNDNLKRTVKQAEDELDLELTFFDVQKAFNKVVDKAAKLGFENTTEPCFSSEQGQYTAGCNFGFSIDKYIFFDELHSTARVHAIIGEMIYRKVADEDEKDDDKEEDREKEPETESED